MQDFIYLDIRGATASFKLPQIYQGFLLSLPAPPYSTVLGILSNITGREITPVDTRIGFKYTFKGKGIDLERYHRWFRNPTGTYSYSNTAVRSREMHFDVRLEIILDNIDLFNEIKNFKRTITFGRSQDIASIHSLKKVEGEHVESGTIKGLLIKSNDIISTVTSGLFYNLPEYFDYKEGLVRTPRNIINFFISSDFESELKVNNLFKVDDTYFYLINWGN